MAIISFWSNGREENGKSSAIVAITTLLGIFYNYRILILDTKYNGYEIEDCFWRRKKLSDRLVNYNSKVQRTDIGTGISGLSKAILSNKITPQTITNYTRIVFKNRLEVLTETDIEKDKYEQHKPLFKEIARAANQYYDLVFVDIDSNLEEGIQRGLLEVSDIIMVALSQKQRKLEEFVELKEEDELFTRDNIIPILTKYDQKSKYTAKNVARYLKYRDELCAINYNTLFFEACNEGTVADFFIKLRNIDEKDKNAVFIKNIKRTAEAIAQRVEDIRRRM